MATAPTEIGEAEVKEIIDIAPLDDERSIHVRFTDGQVGICEKPRNDARIRDADGTTNATAHVTSTQCGSEVALHSAAGSASNNKLVADDPSLSGA